MYSNFTDIPLPIAVWLAANDGYDLNFDPKVLSATTLLQPVRSVVLTRRMRKDQKTASIDIADLIASRLGTAVHTAAEVAWEKYQVGMKNLGIPEKVIDTVRINPEVVNDKNINIYIEQRTSREVLGYKVSGKFDFVCEGRVIDIKTSKTYNYISGSNDERYRMQGSIYRWLNSSIITDDFVDIIYVFTDWSPHKTRDKKYPQKRILKKTMRLMTLDETQAFVENAVQHIIDYDDKPQTDIPQCTPQELWMNPPKFAYHKNPNNLDRATKLFNSSYDAYEYRSTVGKGQGIVLERKSEPTFCKYCDARAICLQAQGYINEGLLKL